MFSGLRMRCGTGLFSFLLLLVSMRVTARGTLPRIDPSIRLPPFAKVEKARAISSGFAASAPSPIAK